MVLVIDPQTAGISGDMVLCCLVDLGADKNKIISGVKSCEKFLPNSSIKTIDFQKTNKNGIEATRLILKVEEKIHERKGIEIKNAIVKSAKHLELSDKAKKFSKSCIMSLLSAESKIHGDSIESVHFHEASSIDTLVDIIGTAIALDDLELFDEKIVTLPVNVGNGTVVFSHGQVSNPASAILEIFRNSSLTIFGSDVKDELTTPTGACILVNLTSDVRDFYPLMKIDHIGYGAGTKNFAKFSNVLKIVKDSSNGFQRDFVNILETNVDDVSGEILGNLVEKIMDKGAKDISIFNGLTKKGRPTNLVKIICNNEKMDKIIDILVSETGTLGIRVSTSERLIVPRENKSIHLNIEGKSFLANYKISKFKEQTRFKIEFDDLKTISNKLNKSIKETEAIINREILKQGD